MTITEFLTARYDEEAMAASHAKAFPPVRPENIAPDVGAIIVDPDRFLADIAAKRAIVRHARQAQEAVEARLTEPPGPVSGHVIAYRDVVSLLAQPYAEHPDFDEGWRVS